MFTRGYHGIPHEISWEFPDFFLLNQSIVKLNGYWGLGTKPQEITD